MHEHMVFGYPGFEGDKTMWAKSHDELMEAAGRDVEAAKAYGVHTFFDATPNDCGRDPVLLRDIAQTHDVNIVCSTAYYYEGEGAPAYFKFRSLFTDIVSEIADLMVTELTDGIAGTGIKAGVIKLGTSENVITPYEQAITKAAARAQQATGAPIITHTQAGTMGPDQARLLVEAGADPAKTIIGHMCGRAGDLDYQKATLAYGVGIGFDRIGGNNLFSDITDDIRMDAIAALIKAGYRKRIFLSHDYVANWLGRDASGFYNLPGAKYWNTSRIGAYILPGLAARGLSVDDIDAMMVINIARLWEV